MKEKLLFKFDENWLGKLDLNFSLKDGRSVLSRNNHSGPFLVQKSFYSDNDNNCIPHVYLLHPPGGLVGGDQLMLSVQLEPDSKALITTPGSAKFYRTNGRYVFQEYVFKLLSNSSLEWLPQSSIFFPKTKAKINTIFKISQGARIISFDMLCFKDFNETISAYPEEVDIFLHISLPCSVGLRDRLKINALNCFNKLSGFRMVALLFAAPSDEILLKQVRALIKPISNIQIGGVTLLDELLVVRLLSNDNQKMKIVLYNIWSVLRPSIIGRKAVMPRIWFT